ncbi:Uncharacterised protein [Chlamydia trachomatis]|nr:Uncharacterised protein [Chlamydia trachomatis]CRH47828.1 Uncharacterised protein [Chlamydia trachomatis]
MEKDNSLKPSIVNNPLLALSLSAAPFVEVRMFSKVNECPLPKTVKLPNKFPKQLKGKAAIELSRFFNVNSPAEKTVVPLGSPITV